MKLSFFKRRLFAPLYASFTLLLLLLLAQEGLSVAVSLLKTRAFDGVIQTFKIKRESERLLAAALEEKVALRGYLLTQDQELLVDYQSNKENFYDGFDRLAKLLEDDSSQQENLTAITAFHSQWQNQFVHPVLEGSLEPRRLKESSSLDELRQTINEILAHERGILDEQSIWLNQLDQLNQINFVLSGLSMSLIIVGSALNLVLLRRRVDAPLQKLMQAGHAWQKGQLGASIDYTSEDEVGKLAKTLNSMAQGIRLRQGTIQRRNEQLEDLICTLSHDLRTPLLANRSTLDAIAGGAFGSIGSELQEILGDYRAANNDLIRLVEVLLDISRYEAKGSQILSREVLNWHKICQRVSHWIQTSSQEKCQLKIQIANDLPRINGDGIEIQRVLQNLVDNAVRLSQPGSEVCICVTASETSSVRVTVQDGGPGLTEQEAKHVFYRFSQGVGRKGRAGLGLYLCRQIVEAHGGSIGVESHSGEGAKFWFSLPIQHPLDTLNQPRQTTQREQIDNHA